MFCYCKCCLKIFRIVNRSYSYSLKFITYIPGILGLTGALLPEQLRGQEQWKEVAGFTEEDLNEQNINGTLWVVDHMRFR